MEQRKNLAKKKRTRREHVTHHVTHVIDDGGANNGTRKSHVHVHEKTIKSPVLPYNKWEAQPGKGTARSESPISHAAGGLGSPSGIHADGNVHHTPTVCSSNGIFETEVDIHLLRRRYHDPSHIYFSLYGQSSPVPASFLSFTVLFSQPPQDIIFSSLVTNILTALEGYPSMLS